MLRMIETFSGIGSQTQALKNIGLDHKVVAISEWDVNAMYAYDILHNGKQDLSAFRHYTKQDLIDELKEYTLSMDGKNPMSERAISSLSILHLKAILCSIRNNNNLVDITKIHAQDLPEADILTYSFPCQDLSISGYWHNRDSGGIDRDANNKSTLLWQVERILKEYVACERDLPPFLLMENVSNILSPRHIDNFLEWQAFLSSLGYINQVYTLDARNFGVPQSRIRTYMISVLATDAEKRREIEDYFVVNSLEHITCPETQRKSLAAYLKVDYSNDVYRAEAIESTPELTPSREKIFAENLILAEGNQVFENLSARTVTTKQDRNPNSGVIAYGSATLTEKNPKYRNLTPRECFLLMGFSEEQFDRLTQENITVGRDRTILTVTKLVKMAGNSIVVQVLEAIFRQIRDLHENYL
ncbi:DNA (cytosine-5-)-methyltransferase [Abiotrophia defectiva]|uniref:Cytosine-specific methyltransferase n=1 Tax=Abiotrophia defectiva ATCC 49176 TaxID=592010 RepID=W1Q1J1_ABIDE|nr:DNA (cytosine-5-)-methyltransferase [Abiotrophia defectiva]ESK64866.1 DNA (cytosine-5-)-methyltransferase [Abiotrophia defectiva ATCC 49176]